ncbi:transposase [Streptomyces sp. NBC_00091]|uniref:transposase n=1 Tax=Streptomyces sp. NBC_00091 TaxID=2975648 RepID=UPI00224FFF5A|nr:transposase [Streptomyces sp. NBC_00091]MCX5374910.1 transposase [Streptomyces sp. NBC_00091]MCX5380257.1 transposase [Streptomyces sp. NBC_00091]
MVGNATRAAIIGDRRVTGLSATVIAELVSELGLLWHERHQARLTSRPRKRALGAGARHQLVFVDRLLATLVHLRHATTHDVLACWFGVDRSTITRAVGEVRPLLAERGCTVSPGVRLKSLAQVVDYLGSSGKTGIIDGTEIRVRRPAVGRKDRDKFISGKSKQNAVKTMVVTDGDGRVCSVVLLGRVLEVVDRFGWPSGAVADGHPDGEFAGDVVDAGRGGDLVFTAAGIAADDLVASLVEDGHRGEPDRLVLVGLDNDEGVVGVVEVADHHEQRVLGRVVDAVSVLAVSAVEPSSHR